MQDTATIGALEWADGGLAPAGCTSTAGLVDGKGAEGLRSSSWAEAASGFRPFERLSAPGSLEPGSPSMGCTSNKIQPYIHRHPRELGELSSTWLATWCDIRASDGDRLWRPCRLLFHSGRSGMSVLRNDARNCLVLAPGTELPTTNGALAIED